MCDVLLSGLIVEVWCIVFVMKILLLYFGIIRFVDDFNLIIVVYFCGIFVKIFSLFVEIILNKGGILFELVLIKLFMFKFFVMIVLEKGVMIWVSCFCIFYCCKFVCVVFIVDCVVKCLFCFCFMFCWLIICVLVNFNYWFNVFCVSEVLILWCFNLVFVWYICWLIFGVFSLVSIVFFLIWLFILKY